MLSNPYRQVTIRRKVGYTNRFNLNGLTGVLKLGLHVLNYTHLGLGKLKLVIKDKAQVIRIVSMPFDQAARHAVNVLSYDYFETVRYGKRVCIPGSSIKGAVRSRIELSSIAYNNTNDFCFSVQGRPPIPPPQVGQHGWRHFKIWDPAVYELRDTCNPESTGVYDLCVGCDMFGAPGVASRVFFGNFCVDGDVTGNLDLDYGEKLEVIKPCTVLEGEISFHGLSLDEFGILLIGLGWCPNINDFKPILMGKSKYRVRTTSAGTKVVLGRVKFEARELKVLTEYLTKDITSKIAIKEVIRGDELKELFNIAVKEAVNKYPSLRNAPCFSEAEKLDELIKKGGIT